MNRLDSYLATHRQIPSEASFVDGQALEEWRIAAFLGKGGSAEVYQVKNVRTGALAAAKILMRDDAVARERFGREAAILAQNDCLSFPRYFARGEMDGRSYLIVELLDQYPLPSVDLDVERYILAICRGVSHLHEHGLVHRDIKPSNVLQRANGEPVLFDFGLVKPISEAVLRSKDDLSILDGKAHGVGTPRYAAPEQFNGDEITPASDIHALGMLLNECFGGKPPRSWWRIIVKSTSSIPSNRYSTVRQFAAAVRHRNRRKHIAICSLALLLLACGAILAWHVIRWASEEIAWDRLCGEQVATNVVQEETISVTWLDKGGLKIPAERRYRIVTNRVEVVPIQLSGMTNAFVNPVRLKGGREYWVAGPGVLDGTFLADGTNVTMRLRSCIVRNHAAEPLDKVGIFYDLQDGAGLDLSELDEPDDHGRHYIEHSGFPTCLNFKKIDWEKPIIWKDEKGTGL